MNTDNTTQSTVQASSPLQLLSQYLQKAGVLPHGVSGVDGGVSAAGQLQQGASGALSPQAGGGDQSLAYLNAIMGGQQAAGVGGQLLGSFGQTVQGPMMDGSAGSSTGTGVLGMLGGLFE